MVLTRSAAKKARLAASGSARPLDTPPSGIQRTETLSTAPPSQATRPAALGYQRTWVQIVASDTGCGIHKKWHYPVYSDERATASATGKSLSIASMSSVSSLSSVSSGSSCESSACEPQSQRSTSTSTSTSSAAPPFEIPQTPAPRTPCSPLRRSPALRWVREGRTDRLIFAPRDSAEMVARNARALELRQRQIQATHLRRLQREGELMKQRLEALMNTSTTSNKSYSTASAVEEWVRAQSETSGGSFRSMSLEDPVAENSGKPTREESVLEEAFSSPGEAPIVAEAGNTHVIPLTYEPTEIDDTDSYVAPLRRHREYPSHWAASTPLTSHPTELL